MTNPGAKSSGRVRFGGFEANLRTGELRRQGCTTPLPNKPFQVLAALAAVLLVASAAESQIPELVEVIEVRVVDVDVIVTDATGRPVSGLSADDFELLVAGEPTEIGYFTAIDGGRVIPSSRAPEALREPPQISTVLPTSVDDPDKPFLAVVYDGQRLRPGEARRALEELRERLDELLAATRGVLVVRQGWELTVEQTMTRDRDLLLAAFDRLESGRPPVVNLLGRDLLMRQMDSAPSPEMVVFNSGELAIGEDRIDQQAAKFLREIRGQAERERLELARTAGQLDILVRSLGGLPGRKAILLLGRGMQARPGEALFRVWWRKYRMLAHRLGVSSLDSAAGLEMVSRQLPGVMAAASSRRVSFYTHDPGGLRVTGASVEFSSAGVTELVDVETAAEQESLRSLALGTGGLERVNRSSLGPLLDEMAAGFRTYYSLGFAPTGDFPDRGGRVEVRTANRDFHLRYIRRAVARTPAQKLEELALAALIADVAENRLEVAVELEKVERRKGGTGILPLRIKVPISKIALLPKAASHVGKLSFVVIARSPSGSLSNPAFGEVPIELENDELLGSLNGAVVYRLRLKVSPGEQKIAISVRDEVSRVHSTLSLLVESGQSL